MSDTSKLRSVPPIQMLRQAIRSDVPQSVNPSDFCNVEGAAALLGVQRRAIYDAVRQDRLPVMKLGEKGRVWRFYKPDVLRLRQGGMR